MRILIGTVEIGGVIPMFANGFRQLGHQVTTVIKEKHTFFSDIQYDVDISSEVLPWPAQGSASSPALKLIRKNLNRAALLARLLPLIAQHDLFIFLWAGTSLTERNQEFPLLKKLGKRIVSLFCGSDVRHSSGYSQFFTSLVSENSFVDWHSLRDFATEPLSQPLRHMRTAERYSDLILSMPNNSMLAVRPYKHFFVPVDLSKFKERIPAREIPVIVHAPSDETVKGSKRILSVLEKLRSEGVAFELRFLHGVPHQQVLDELTDADVAVDQLNLPLHGMFGLEAMASGCTLATCNREDYEPFPPNRPIWHVDAGNLYAQLKSLLTDKELRIRLARDGRKYVERYHDNVQVARRMLDALSAVQPQYDHYPTFFARSYTLPEAEIIPEYLKRMTTEIIQRWGLPVDIDPREIIRRGLMSANGLHPSEPIPRWIAPSLEANTVSV